jgi:hypothetical protein
VFQQMACAVFQQMACAVFQQMASSECLLQPAKNESQLVLNGRCRLDKHFIQRFVRPKLSNSLF